jgi:hypothetical protein
VAKAPGAKSLPQPLVEFSDFKHEAFILDKPPNARPRGMHSEAKLKIHLCPAMQKYFYFRFFGLAVLVFGAWPLPLWPQKMPIPPPLNLRLTRCS